MPLPLSVEDLTADWLTEALSARTPGTKVASADLDSVIWGTATKAFLDVVYADRPDDGPPTKLCVKGALQEDLRAVAGIGCRLEAAFYRDLAPHLDIPLVPAWFAAVDENQNQGLIIIDDLRPGDVKFGRAGMTYTVDEVAATLEIVARWHAATWERSGPADAPWLTVGSPFYRHAMESLYFLPEHWDRMLELPQTASLDDALRDRERVIAAVHRQWELDDAGPLTLSHGDSHIGNTYRVPDDPAARFLDWQVLCLAPWADDVAYFTVGSLTVDERRTHEDDLLRHYLDVLAANGAPAPNLDDARTLFRRQHLHGLMFAFCPPEMQDPDDCARMAERYGQAAIDHDTLALLEDSVHA